MNNPKLAISALLIAILMAASAVVIASTDDISEGESATAKDIDELKSALGSRYTEIDLLSVIQVNETLVVDYDVKITSSGFGLVREDGFKGFMVSVTAGTLTLSAKVGGDMTIDGNSAYDDGSGVWGSLISVNGGKLVISADVDGKKVILQKNFTSSYSDTIGYGGAVQIGCDSAGEMVMDGGLIKDCSTIATNAGGGVSVGLGRLGGVSASVKFTMNNGLIQNCNSHSDSQGGGGVRVNYGTFDMTGGIIADCYALNNGGGVLISANYGDTVMNMSGGMIRDNTAKKLGGGVFVSVPNTAKNMASFIMTSDDACVTGNLANLGGGIYCDDGIVRVSGGNITGNGVDSDNKVITVNGGGIYFEGKLNNETKGLYLSGGNIDSNKAISGAGVYVSVTDGSGTVEFSGTDFDGNNASAEGGAICINSTVTSYIKGGLFQSNYAKSNGGAVALVSGSLEVSNSTFIKNSSDGSGGAIYKIGSGKTMTIGTGTIIGTEGNPNNSTNGGGIFVKSGIVNINDGAKIEYNTAKNGGGLRLEGGYTYMSGGSISYNEATSNGGGMVVKGSGEMTLFEMTGGDMIYNKANGSDSTSNAYDMGTGACIHVFCDGKANVTVNLLGGKVNDNVSNCKGTTIKDNQISLYQDTKEYAAMVLKIGAVTFDPIEHAVWVNGANPKTIVVTDDFTGSFLLTSYEDSTKPIKISNVSEIVLPADIEGYATIEVGGSMTIASTVSEGYGTGVYSNETLTEIISTVAPGNRVFIDYWYDGNGIMFESDDVTWEYWDGSNYVEATPGRVYDLDEEVQFRFTTTNEDFFVVGTSQISDVTDGVYKIYVPDKNRVTVTALKASEAFKVNSGEISGIESNWPETYNFVVMPTHTETTPITGISAEKLFGDNNNTLRSILIPSNYRTMIGSAFENANGLVYAKIYTTTLSYSMFKGCNSLKTLYLADGTETIPSYMLNGCTQLDTCTIPGTVKDIGDCAFSGTVLKSVSIPAETTLGVSIFEGCTALEAAFVGTGIHDVPDKMFSGCSALAMVGWDEIKNVGDYAFEGCTHLAVKNTPNLDGLVSVGKHAFCNTWGLDGDGEEEEKDYIVITAPALKAIGDKAFHVDRDDTFSRLQLIIYGEGATVGTDAFMDNTSAIEVPSSKVSSLKATYDLSNISIEFVLGIDLGNLPLAAVKDLISITGTTMTAVAVESIIDTITITCSGIANGKGVLNIQEPSEYVAGITTPVVAGRTATTAVLNKVDGYEYSKDGGNTFQALNDFNGLTPNMSYSFVQRPVVDGVPGHMSYQVNQKTYYATATKEYNNGNDSTYAVFESAGSIYLDELSKSTPEYTYLFEGWFSGTGDGSRVSAGGVNYSVPAGDNKVWAKFTVPGMYTVTYNYGNSAGDSVFKQLSYYENASVSVISDEPAWADHEFNGWKDSQSTEFKSYSAGSDLKLTGNTALYAKWVANKPASMAIESVGPTSIIVAPVSGCQYAIGSDGSLAWSDSNEFTGLMSDTQYVVYMRVAPLGCYSAPSEGIFTTVTTSPGVVFVDVTTIAGFNGSITPGYVAEPISEGTSLTFSITPDPGFYVEDVKVNGVSVGKVTSYTMVTGSDDIIIEASFVSGWDITVLAAEHGTINHVGYTNVEPGTEMTFELTPDEFYQIVGLYVNDVLVSTESEYTLKATSDVSVRAVFERMTYIVTSSASANGTITPAGEVEVNAGESMTYTVTPDEGYYVVEVVVNGESRGAVTSLTVTPTEDTTVIASFVVGNVVSVTSSEGGYVEPSGSIVVDDGTMMSFTVTANEGYALSDVFVNGVSIGPMETFEWSIYEDTAIYAEFFNNEHEVTLSSGENGYITPSGTIMVAEGEPISFSVFANDGFFIKDVKINGVSVGDAATFTFTPTEDTLVMATFVRGYTVIVEANAGGTISPSGTSIVTEGTTVTYTVESDMWHDIGDVTVNDVPTPATEAVETNGNEVAYYDVLITEDVSVVANFVRTAPAIVASSAHGGSISPEGETLMQSGSSITYYVTPDEEYTIASIVVDGVSMGAVSTYTFDNVTRDHTIYASFSGFDTVNVQLNVSGQANMALDGVVIDGGVVASSFGVPKTLSIVPDDGYYLYSVTVDGQSLTLSDDEREDGASIELMMDADMTVEVVSGAIYGERVLSASDEVSIAGSRIKYNGMSTATAVTPSSVDWNFAVNTDRAMAYQIEAYTSNGTDPYQGELIVSIFIGTQYNGTTATMLHKDGYTGLTEAQEVEVVDGYVFMTVSSLSPFLVELPDVEDITLYLLLGILALILIISLIAMLFRHKFTHRGFEES